MTIIPMILAMSIALAGVTWVIFFMGELGGDVKGAGAPTPPNDKEPVAKLALVKTDANGTVEATAPAAETETSRAA